MMGRALVMTAVISISVAVSTTLALQYWLLPQPRPVVQFDVDKTADAFSRQLAQSQLPHQQQMQLSRQFADALVAQTKSYAAEHDVIVVTAPAVLAGAPDVSRAIAQRVKEHLDATP